MFRFTTHQSVVRRVILTVCLTGLCLAMMPGLAACGQQQADSPKTDSVSADMMDQMFNRDKGEKWASSMSEYIDQQLAQIDSDKELKSFDTDGTATARKKDILERAKKTGSISAADYEAVWADYTQCLQDIGVNMVPRKLPNGIYTEEYPDAKPADASAHPNFGREYVRCGTLYTAYIDGTYKMQQDNPNLFKNGYEGAVDCMHRKDLVPKDYTMDSLKHDLYDITSPDEAIVDVYSTGIGSCLIANGINIGGVR